jgi:hypothetical protein
MPLTATPRALKRLNSILESSRNDRGEFVFRPVGAEVGAGPRACPRRELLLPQSKGGVEPPHSKALRAGRRCREVKSPRPVLTFCRLGAASRAGCRPKGPPLDANRPPSVNPPPSLCPPHYPVSLSTLAGQKMNEYLLHREAWMAGAAALLWRVAVPGNEAGEKAASSRRSPRHNSALAVCRSTGAPACAGTARSGGPTECGWGAQRPA